MRTTQEIIIDIQKPRQNVMHVVQEDSTRHIRLVLLENNLPFNPAVDLDDPSDLLAFVEFRKPDGHGGIYDTTSLGETAVQVEDSEGNNPNIFIVALDGQCFTCPGWTQINIRFETEDGRRIHTFRIMVDVEPSASSDTESTDWNDLESIAGLRQAVVGLWETRVSMEAKNALLNLLAHVAYVDEHGQDYYDELETELFRTAGIVSISAVFNQGSATIYNIDPLDVLRQYLTVTATYEDLSTAVVTNYTLSGTLTVGTSTITVSYGGKTATFDVVVSDFMVNDILTLDAIRNTRNGHNASATAWEDLSGNQNDFEKYSTNAPLWNEKYAKFDATNRQLRLVKDLFGNQANITIEIVACIDGNGSSQISGTSYYCGGLFGDMQAGGQTAFGAYSYNAGGISSYYASTSLGYSSTSNSPFYIAWVISNNSCTRYLNGVANTPVSISGFSSETKRDTFIIGSFTGAATYFNGKIYRIGMSAKAMTADEIASRYAMYKSRFDLPE